MCFHSISSLCALHIIQPLLSRVEVLKHGQFISQRIDRRIARCNRYHLLQHRSHKLIAAWGAYLHSPLQDRCINRRIHASIPSNASMHLIAVDGTISSTIASNWYVDRCHRSQQSSDCAVASTVEPNDAFHRRVNDHSWRPIHASAIWATCLLLRAAFLTVTSADSWRGMMKKVLLLEEWLKMLSWSPDERGWWQQNGFLLWCYERDKAPPNWNPKNILT